MVGRHSLRSVPDEPVRSFRRAGQPIHIELVAIRRLFLRKTIRQMAETRMRYGYRRIDVLLRREGWCVEYHHERPHGTDLTPCKFLQQAHGSRP